MSHQYHHLKCPLCGAPGQDLIFMDLRWRFDDGYEWHQEIKPHDPETPAMCVICGWKGQRQQAIAASGIPFGMDAHGVYMKQPPRPTAPSERTTT